MTVLAGARVMHSVLNAPKEDVENFIFGVLNENSSANLGVEDAVQLLIYLSSPAVNSTRVEEFREACKKRFELSTVFMKPEELEESGRVKEALREVIGEVLKEEENDN
jgi:N-alpha-acetyltransferase 15/16, NatA auxiliary subunit